MKTKKRFYTNGVKTIKLSDCDKIPDGFYLGRTFKSNPWNKGLSADSNLKVKLNTESCHRTRRLKNNYISWNTGLTKETNESLKQVSIKVSKYRKENPMTEDKKIEMVEHINATKNKNNSFNTSKPEDDYYKYLLTKYDENDIERQYYDKKRYPFKCDFYIKSEDKFIECNYSWCHGTHPFNKESKEDICLFNEKLEKSKKSKYHAYALKIWTEIDPLKLKTFRDNNLNFMIIYKDIVITK